MEDTELVELLESIEQFDLNLNAYWEHPASRAIIDSTLRVKARSLAQHLDALGLARLAADLRFLELDEVGAIEYLQALQEQYVPLAKRAARPAPNRGAPIPPAVVLGVGDALGKLYYSHARLNALFADAGAPGDAPAGNCVVKCQTWLRRANASPSTRPLEVLGGILPEVMESELSDQVEEWVQAKSRIQRLLAKNGLEYRAGGMVVEVGAGLASRTLEEALADGDYPSIEAEFERALRSATDDPASALTAACSIIEAMCKVYIEENGLEMPKKLTIKPLWASVQAHLGLDPAAVEDQDLRRILGGLSSVVDGLGALRTHAGSAHGRGSLRYRVSPRHARLAVNAAHTLVGFVMETWSARRDTN